MRSAESTASSSTMPAPAATSSCSDTSPEQIPTPIKGGTRYVVDTEDGYEDLYRRLTGQPRLLRPALGTIERRCGQAVDVAAGVDGDVLQPGERLCGGLRAAELAGDAAAESAVTATARPK